MRIIIAAVALVTSISFFGFTANHSTITAKRVTAEGAKINWMSWDEMLQAQEKAPKKIFIDMYTDWCGWCKRMDANTFSNKIISDYVNEHYYAVKFDAEQKGDLSFKGTTYKFIGQGKRGYHELAAQLMGGKMSYPTTVYLDEEMNLLTTVPGYLAPNKLDVILNWFGSNTYKKVTFPEFEKSFKSKTKS